MNLPKNYIAKDYEASVYEAWMRSGAFQPREKAKEHFSIVMPPPNATGKLHVGHAAMLAIEDSIVRYRRMQGDSVLWVPGMDHAAIATNAVVEKQLAAEGTDKHELGRDKFLGRLHEYVDDSIDVIRTQIKAMGSSADWSRERYTMEPAMNRIVNEMFISMHDDGLIYRGSRIVNWDPFMQTTVSDDELEYKAETTTLYTLQYGPFEIATARPETKFGDKYVVMHPDDERYAKYEHGDTFEAEWINGTVTATVIKDDVIDPEFGTGVMTITPWHDAVDFDIAQRHNLDMQQIIDFDGTLLEVAGDFAGQHIAEARKGIVELLRDKGLLLKEDDKYEHNIAVNYRGKGVIEPQIKAQWFVDVNKEVVDWHGKKRSLKQIMQSTVRDGEIEILPNRFNKTYFSWVDNLRDWCVSRQIWWGHRIPAWFRTVDGEQEVVVSADMPEGDGWKQDEDTLDTWFSSALWTWSTLIDPEVALDEANSIEDMLKKSPDFKNFHPTTLMETGYDIIFFWVARMILMTTYATKQLPFKTVYLHGLVRTKDGSKMSKSTPETSVDPLDMIEKYGTDALRLSLLVGQAPGNDMRIFESKIESYRNFCNKLWNIARFIEGKLPNTFDRNTLKDLSSPDHWILHRLNETLAEVDKYMQQYSLGHAYEAVYHFVWDDFADWYIEASKTKLNESVLGYVLEVVLKITHPFAPFVTETIWDTLEWEAKKDDGSHMLISAEWPKATKVDIKQAEEFAELQKIVSEIRHLQTQLQLSGNYLYYSDGDFIAENAELIVDMTKLEGVRKVASGKGLHLTKTKHTAWVDIEEQKAADYIAKLIAQREKQKSVVIKTEARLANKSYVDNAPAEIVEQSKQHLADAQAMVETLDREIETFEYALKQGSS